MKPLDLCANGCGVPPSPPSLVICRKCQDAITRRLEGMLRDMDKGATAPPDEGRET